MTASTGYAGAEELTRNERGHAALEQYLGEAAAYENPPPALCLKLARTYERLGSHKEGHRWALACVDGGHDFVTWQSAWRLLHECRDRTSAARTARVAVLGSYTTTQFSALLGLAALRAGIDITLYESDYSQYRQAILDPNSPLYAFEPDFIVLAVHAGDVALPLFSRASAESVQVELQRWTDLWFHIRRSSNARIIQHMFALPPEQPMGHLGARLGGSRYRMLQALNCELGDAAGAEVALVDCERLAALVGARSWFDPRYWHLAKYAVAPDQQPLLARHTAAVLAAELGLSRKCLVVDLDNTIWGGIVGEDGVANLSIGDGLEGEAYVAFQEYLLSLKERGVLLAVCSKNNPEDAREPFELRPEMRLHLDDVACFMVGWEPKSEQIRRIARTLNLGLDALVFVDDNPAEREIIRQALPEVDVVTLPADPSGYVRALSEYLFLEPHAFTAEDAQRTEQYRARAQLAHEESNATSLDDFYRSLQMQARIAPFNDTDLPRIAQLIGKSNQFNTTSRRHGPPQLNAFRQDPDCVHQSLRLRDRFADHGLVSVLIAFQRGDVLDIDTWLMSCRVIGRTVEAELLGQLAQRAVQRGCRWIRGTYIPTSKNAMVADLYTRLGFTLDKEHDGTTEWLLDVRSEGMPQAPGFIEVTCDVT